MLDQWMQEQRRDLYRRLGPKVMADHPEGVFDPGVHERGKVVYTPQ